jgi:hypothetical protein
MLVKNYFSEVFIVLFYLAHLVLVDVDEVDCGEGCECHFEREYGWVLFHRHEVSVLKYVREN